MLTLLDQTKFPGLPYGDYQSSWTIQRKAHKMHFQTYLEFLLEMFLLTFDTFLLLNHQYSTFDNYLLGHEGNIGDLLHFDFFRLAYLQLGKLLYSYIICLKHKDRGLGGCEQNKSCQRRSSCLGQENYAHGLVKIEVQWSSGQSKLVKIVLPVGINVSA